MLTRNLFAPQELPLCFPLWHSGILPAKQKPPKRKCVWEANTSKVSDDERILAALNVELRVGGHVVGDDPQRADAKAH